MKKSRLSFLDRYLTGWIFAATMIDPLNRDFAPSFELIYELFRPESLRSAHFCGREHGEIAPEDVEVFALYGPCV